jgi:hypothetical protein
MPIIRDPKQNPIEGKYGIVFFPDGNHPEKGKHYKYEKFPNSVSRLCMAGEDAEFEDSRTEYDKAEWIDGIKIYGEVTFKRRLPEEEQQGPVYRRLLPTLTLAARRKAIKDAIDQDEMESELEP